MVIFLVILFAAVAFIGGSMYSYFQKTTVVQSTAGTQSAILYRLLSTPELSYMNTKNATEKLIFDIRKLDKYGGTSSNHRIPGSDFSGSYYFIEIHSVGTANGEPPSLTNPEILQKWSFSNIPNIAKFKDYAYNTRLRGYRPVDERAIEFCIPQGKKWTLSEYSASLRGDPFFGMDLAQLQVPVNIVEGENVLPAAAYWLIDPDSSYAAGDYEVKYPLCICDLECPVPQGCKCSKDCSGSDTIKEVLQGQGCNS